MRLVGVVIAVITQHVVSLMARTLPTAGGAKKWLVVEVDVVLHDKSDLQV